jgi:hypothetical protein
MSGPLEGSEVEDVVDGEGEGVVPGELVPVDVPWKLWLVKLNAMSVFQTYIRSATPWIRSRSWEARGGWCSCYSRCDRSRN